MPELIIGVDLALKRDWTAIVGVERQEADDGKYRYDVVHLERGRWELARVVSRVGNVRDEAIRQYGRDHVWTTLDWTGAGIFAVGPFKEADLRPIPMCITGGVKPKFAWRSTEYYRNAANTDAQGTVPKRELVSVLQVLVETGRLRFAAELPGLDILVHELENFRAKINVSGQDTYEAWREGDHDDTVLATALACWIGERALPAIQSTGVEATAS